MDNADRMANTSPLPWHYRPDFYDDWGWIRDANGETVGHAHTGIASEIANAHRSARTDPYEANARLIVRAVNLYDGLVAALQLCVQALEAEYHGDDEAHPSCPCCGAVTEGRAALAKAEERG